MVKYNITVEEQLDINASIKCITLLFEHNRIYRVNYVIGKFLDFLKLKHFLCQTRM